MHLEFSQIYPSWSWKVLHVMFNLGIDKENYHIGNFTVHKPYKNLDFEFLQIDPPWSWKVSHGILHFLWNFSIENMCIFIDISHCFKFYE